MPAPAGSKGPIKPSQIRAKNEDFEVIIAASLWGGNITPETAEDELARRFFALATLSIETNLSCPLHCEYCYLNERPRAKPAELQCVAEFIEQAANSGVRRFAFVGKEPLADDRAIALITLLEGRSNRNELQVGLVTNGLYADRQIAKLSKLTFDYLDVSLDGLAGQNDRWRGAGTFERALHAISLFSQLPRAPLVVNSVLHKGNMLELERFMDKAQEHGARNFSFAPVLDLTGAESVASLGAEPEQLFEPVWSVLAEYADANPTCQVMLDLPVGWTMLGIQGGFIEFRSVLRDVNGVCYVQPRKGAPFFVKVQLVPQDTWRWARLTHDGHYLGRLRAAASREYVHLAAGNIRDRSFAELFDASIKRSGWISEEWDRALTWASGAVAPPLPTLRVVA